MQCRDRIVVRAKLPCREANERVQVEHILRRHLTTRPCFRSLPLPLIIPTPVCRRCCWCRCCGRRFDHKLAAVSPLALTVPCARLALQPPCTARGQRKRG